MEISLVPVPVYHSSIVKEVLHYLVQYNALPSIQDKRAIVQTVSQNITQAWQKIQQGTTLSVDNTDRSLASSYKGSSTSCN